MQVVSLRVGIDTGSGGIHGPLFKNRDFEFIPICDKRNRFGANRETYGNTKGQKHRKLLVEYFPESQRYKMRDLVSIVTLSLKHTLMETPRLQRQD